MGSIASLNAALRWDLSDFDRGTAHIDGVFGRLRATVSGVADAFVAAGQRMTVGITLPLAGLASYTIKAASDAQELQSAFDYTFGAMASRMNAWAEQTGDAMGRSTQEMQQGAMALGQLFRAAAPTEAAAASLSQQFTVLAQDASSFFNVGFEDALDRLRSGLTGEAEPLRKFGVFLSEAKVEAKALELGLIKVGEELNEEGKIMARAAVIAEELAAAKGDVARTSDSLANQTRALWGDIHELAVEMGEILVPAVADMVGALRQAVQWFKSLPEGVKETIVKMLLFAAAIGPVMMVLTKLATVVLPLLLVNLGPVAAALSFLINPIGTLVVIAGKFIVEMGGIGAVFSRLVPLVLRFLGPWGLLIGALLLFKDQILEVFSTVWNVMSDVLGPKLGALFDAVIDLVDTLYDAFAALAEIPFVRELGEALLTFGIEAWTIWATVVAEAIGAVIDLITLLVQAITMLVDVTVALFSGDWSSAWQGIADVVDSAIGRIVAKLHWALGPLAQFLRLKAMVEGGESGGGFLERGIGTMQAVLGGARWMLPEGEGEAGGAGGRDYAVPGSGGGGRKTGGRGRGRSGPSAEELAARREEIRLEQELSVAREKGDMDAVRALERQRELKQQIERYERAGLSNAQAKTAAEKDMLELDQARAEAQAKELLTHERSIQMKLAELRGDYEELRLLEDDEFIEKRILELQRMGLSLAEAELTAARDLLHLDEARADALARRNAQAERARQIELAQLRGDDALAARLGEDGRFEDRVDELRQGGKNETDAREQAMREATDRNRAHLQGTFRDTFRQGLRAALDGDLKNFFRTWLEDASFNALAKVLDRLADRLADLAFGQSSGGGLLDTILGAVSTAAGFAGGGGASKASIKGSAKQNAKLPGFNSGGSFRIAGFAGVDSNLLSLNGNPIARVSSGEILDVRQGGQSPRGELVVRLEKDGGLTAHMEGIAGRVVVAAAPDIAGMGSDMAMSRIMRARDRSLAGA